MLPEKDYGRVCFLKEKYLSSDGRTYFEIVAQELSEELTPNEHFNICPENNLKKGEEEGYDFVMQNIGYTNEGQGELVYVMVSGPRFVEFLNRVDELAGGKLLHPNKCSVRVPDEEADIDEIPVAQLPCPVEKHSFLKSLNNKFQLFKLRIKT